jgi:glutamate dehydrogenase
MSGDAAVQQVQASVRRVLADADGNLCWLERNVPILFSGVLRQDLEALTGLAVGMPRVTGDRQLVAADREKELLVAQLDVPGSIFATLHRLRDRELSRAEIFHSVSAVPGTGRPLEIQHYTFDRKRAPLAEACGVIPGEVRRAIEEALASDGVQFEPAARDELLRTFWVNDERYVAHAPPRQVARMMRLLWSAQSTGGFTLEVEEADPGSGPNEVKVLFAVESPPLKGHLAQVIDVFNRLELGVRRSLTLIVSTATRPVFLGSFHVAPRAGGKLERDSELFRRLRRALYNTQILATESPAYEEFVLTGVLTGEEASLLNAFIGFCHTNLAHNQPHRYTLEDVVRAFRSHPDISRRLARLFETRFDPEAADREARYAVALAEMEREVATYNTGHSALDDFRRSVFRTVLVFIRRTLKTNYFVPEKHALAFRLDPAYLDDLGPEFTGDLPPERPFRVTFFFGRSGLGYHIGFADIARGGWRTIVTRTRDDYVTVANRVFRENYVLAHTQHLKNKDIYEGGSKLVVVIRAPDVKTPEQMNRRMHRVQLDFAGAFLDIFVTENGRAKDRRVVDFYGEDEPIELGPDENMHDEMIEQIAALSRSRGYVLGTGIMSSKRVGINHKEYGVTSLGVVAMAEIAMHAQGVNIHKDPFTVKLTGGPNGDVAGNGLRLLLERCPEVRVRLVLDGTAAVYDPGGLDREALSKIVLRDDADAFDAGRLGPGGYVLYRNRRRTEGLRELFCSAEVTAEGLSERWLTQDEFFQRIDGALFEVEADLFIPAGGRPETIDEQNWRRFLSADGKPSAKVIVEGANSFITPGARRLLQEAGIVILRDASANKCGVISSSYEIIGNLLFSEEEFLAHKESYVRDVLAILERRARDEALLLFRRYRDEGGKRSFTELSDAVSAEINARKAELFAFFHSRPEADRTDACQRALVAHLPRMLRDPAWRGRTDRLPSKYRAAILAAEIAGAMVYRRSFVPDFGASLAAYIDKMF